MKRLGLLIAVISSGLLFLAVVVPAALRAAKNEQRAAITILDASQSRLAERGIVRLSVRTPRAGRHRVVVGLTKGRSRITAASRSIRLQRGTRRITVGLSETAQRRLAACARQRLIVTVVRGNRRVARTSRVLGSVPRCTRNSAASRVGTAPSTGAASATSSSSPRSDAASGATSAAAADKADKKPDKPKGDKPKDPPSAPEDPGFDTADMDRCDPIDPALCLQPFPNNHFTLPDATTKTGRRVNFNQESMPANRFGKRMGAADYNWSDGFPAGTSIVTRVPGLDTMPAFRNSELPPIDDPERSLDETSPIQVINASTGEPHLVWAEIDSNPEDPAQRNLIIRPAKHFEEGATYVVVLRNLRDKDGEPIDAQRPFEVFRDRIFTTDTTVEERRVTMERDVFAPLKAAGIDRKELYLAWDFTVASAESTTGRMLSIRDRAFAELGDTNLADRKIQGDSPQARVYPNRPDLPFDGEIPAEAPQVDGIREYADGPILRKVTGQIVVPCYLNLPGCPPGAQFQLGADGLPVQLPGNTTTYEWACNIPRTKDPEQKVRPMLYGHGLLGDGQEIDWGGNPDFGAQHGYMYCGIDWNGMAFKDIPNVVTILQDASRFASLSDGIQQGFLGFLYLGRALMHPQGVTTDPAFGGRVDQTELFYDGNSQGGIYGGSLLAIAPDYERAVLGVPGMNYSTLLHRSVDFDKYAEGEFVDGQDSELGMYDNYPNELERPLLFGLIQMLWDRSDPSGYAAHMTDDPLPNTPSHKALLQVGFGDHQVADVTTEVEARTIGARVHRPGIAAGRDRYTDRPYPDQPAGEFFQGVPSLESGYDGSGVVFYDTGDNPPPPAGNVPPREGDDPHENVRRDPKARDQKAAFLSTNGRIVDYCGGMPCTAG